MDSERHAKSAILHQLTLHGPDNTGENIVTFTAVLLGRAGMGLLVHRVISPVTTATILTAFIVILTAPAIDIEVCESEMT